MSLLKMSQRFESTVPWDTLMEYKFQVLAWCIAVFAIGRLLIQVKEHPAGEIGILTALPRSSTTYFSILSHQYRVRGQQKSPVLISRLLKPVFIELR